MREIRRRILTGFVHAVYGKMGWHICRLLDLSRWKEAGMAKRAIFKGGVVISAPGASIPWPGFGISALGQRTSCR